MFSLQIACFFLPFFPLLFYTSTSLAILSISTSYLLVHKHQPLSNAGAGPAHDYLSAVCSPRIKFQGVAFAYALPKTFFLSGFLASFSQVVYILCHYVSPHFLLLSGTVLSSALLITDYATRHTQFNLQTVDLDYNHIREFLSEDPGTPTTHLEDDPGNLLFVCDSL